MATSLARQLEKLAAPQSALVVHKRSRPSLLFDKREAALLDRDTVFSIGVDGFEDLRNLNPAFLKYQETLFSENAKTMERAVQTKEVNNQLDEVLEEFLCLLCPYFLLKPAQKALEWLVYRFHIQDFNVNALLRCIFPYHDTNMFVRALQLLRLKEETNRWHWLYPLQDPGVPLSKAALARHCAENLGFMKFLCVMNKKMMKVHGSGSRALHAPVAFFVTAVAAGLERCAAVTEPQLALLVPHLLRCLASPLDELRAGGYMLAAQLARRAALSAKLNARLFTALVKSLTEPLETECVTALAALAQTQTLQRVPSAAMEPLGRSLAPLTAALTRVGQRRSVLPLLSCLLRTCLLQAAEGDAAAGAMAMTLTTDVRAESPREQELIIRSAVELFLERGSVPAGPLLAALCPVLAAMERMYPAPFDAVLGQLSAGGGRPLAPLLTALRGRVGGAAGCGVFVDLNHPEESTRYGAVKQLMTSLREDKVSDTELVRTALLSTLQDDSDRIVKLALKVPVEKSLSLVGEEELAGRLIACLDAGHGGSVSALCARALAALHAAGQDRSRPPDAALLTALLAAAGGGSADQQCRTLAEAVCPELAAFLEETPGADGAVRLEAALDRLARELGRLPAAARRDTLAALAARLARPELGRPVRLAAAALAASCLRRDGDGAGQTLAPLRPLLEEARLKASGESGWSPELGPLDLLQAGEEASLPAALLCLLSAVIEAAGVTDVSEVQWWSLAAAGSDRLMALVELWESTAVGLSQPRSRSRPLHQAIISVLFKSRLPTLAAQVAFLAQFWSAETGAAAGRPEPRRVAAQVTALVTAGALLAAAPAARLASLLALSACLLPSLLAALQSPLAQVRTAAMECVQKVATVKMPKGKPAPLLPLANQLVAFDQEIITDPEALARCLAEGDRDWLPQLVEVVVSEEVPDHVRASIASLLPPLADQETLRRCAPLLSSLVAAAAAGGAPLSPARSALTAGLLRLIAAPSAGCLPEPTVWEAVTAALAAPADRLTLPDGPCSPQALLLKQVTRQLFAALDDDTQTRLLTLLVDLCTDTDQPAVSARIHKVVRRLPLTADQLVHQLGENDEVAPVKKTVRDARTTRRRAAALAATATASQTEPAEPAEPAAAAAAADDESVSSRPWRRRTVVLELLQARRRLDAPPRLLAALFALLRRLLRLADQPAAEYQKQLALTCLQQACGRLQGGDAPPPAEALRARFSVDTLVHCVRSSDSPQTHQLALIVLGMAAAMLPEMVLHNIMAIFTFMGSSMLRQDNEYSFRVIEKTVECVVPTLVQASSVVSPGGQVIVPVLRVFVDAVRDVPRHRRLPLFTHLLRTVGDQRHLWICLVMLSDQLATRGDVRDKMAEDTVTGSGDKGGSQLIEFAVNLCGEFSLETQLLSCSRLLEHTETFIHLRHDGAGSPKKRRRAASEAEAADPALFDLEAHTDKQFYKYCHTAIGLITQLLGSEAFVAQSAAPDETAAATAREQHQQLLERAVRLITSCTQLSQTALAGRPDDVRHVRAILHRLYALLDKVNALLPSSMFLSVVSGLLGSSVPVVRRRAAELLAARLQLQAEFFTEADTDALLRLTRELLVVAQSAADAAQQEDADGGQQEDAGAALNRQTALFALKLLSRLLAARHPAAFVPVLRAVCQLAADAALPPALFASCLLCLAELCASLRAHAISRLPPMAAVLLRVLSDDERLSNELVLVSAVTLTQKLVESLPHFVSPYLTDLLRHVCRLSAEHGGRGPSSPLQHRLRQTRHQLATAVPVRLLVPAVDQCFQLMTADGSAGVSQLMAMLAECVAAAELTQLNAVLAELQALVLRALEYRGSQAAAAAARDIEGDVIGAVTSLVPRLSETTFRPFFLRLFDWASRAEAPPARLITFYRLADALAERLKGLFVLFAGHFVRHLATVLENTNSISESPLFPDDEESACELADYALDCLSKVCAHDTEGFLNKERFQLLMQPLVDQLESDLGSEARRQARLEGRLVPCLVNFLVAAGDDSLWKPANYQVLLKMRHQSAEVRLAAVAALSAVHARLGDDYMTLLPETMPFLAELLEDEEPRVETACQRLIREMEETLGESLQRYF